MPRNKFVALLNLSINGVLISFFDVFNVSIKFHMNDFIKKKFSVGLGRLNWMHNDVENLQNIFKKTV